MASTTSPNMNLTVPGIGTENSPQWATDVNASLSAIDSHNHSSGQGVPVQPNGMNIDADLAFQNNNATILRSTRFSSQSAVLSGALDLGCLYVVGNELYYNDVTGGHNVQITSNGTVNATSSGIASGTASAAFSAGVLVVKSSSVSGGNILMQSLVLTNSGNLTNQLTLEAPALSGSYALALPTIPAALSFVTLDTSGNLATSNNVSGIQIASASITGNQLAPQTVVQGNLALRFASPTAAVGGIGQAGSSGNFTTTSTSAVAVTNLSCTLTTSGRPVMIVVQGGSFFQCGLSAVASPTSNAGAVAFQIRNGINVINYAQFIASAGSGQVVPPGALSCLDLSVINSPGTYTYSVYAVALVSGSTAGVLNCQILAYEI